MLNHLLQHPLRIAQKLLSVLPSSCALCGHHGDHAICRLCRQKHLRQTGTRCSQCALPLPPGAEFDRCGACLRDVPAFDHTVAACDYRAPLDQLVLGLKFGKQLALAPAIAEAIRDSVLLYKSGTLPELLCPVPLGERRLAERGYNQALEIARPLSQLLGIPLQRRLLVRLRDTEQQSGLHPEARRKNVRQAFLLAPNMLGQIEGKHIAVVDDVMTTGTTLQEIATMLKRFGASEVSNYVFARTPPH